MKRLVSKSALENGIVAELLLFFWSEALLQTCKREKTKTRNETTKAKAEQRSEPKKEGNSDFLRERWPTNRTVEVMEFKSYKDDAWYDVRIETESNGDSGGNGRRLRVKFSGFADEHDEVVDGKDLKSFKDVDFLRCRFRPMSVQLQDTECSQVHKGLSVCAAHSAYPDDRRFYDAIVDGVSRFISSLSLCL